MSAYMMDSADIAPLVEFAVQHKIAFHDAGGLRHASRDNASRLGQLLMNANQESVNYRYREQTKTPRYDHVKPDIAPTVRGASRVAFLQRVADAASCLDYQACEPPGWTQSEAHAVLARINAKLVSILSHRDSRHV